jgi:streptomycin 6-kinase
MSGNELDPDADPLETFSAATRARFGEDVGPWIDRLPGLIAELTARWSVEIAGAVTAGDAYRVEATRAGARLHLELSYPDGWWDETTRALEAWNGHGVLRLVERDVRGARLLERSAPVTTTDDGIAALRDACAVARELWIPSPGGITAVADEVRVWGSELSERHARAGSPFEREIVRHAADLFATLGPTQGDRVLLHGDLRLATLGGGGGGGGGGGVEGS